MGLFEVGITLAVLFRMIFPPMKSMVKSVTRISFLPQTVVVLPKKLIQGERGNQ